MISRSLRIDNESDDRLAALQVPEEFQKLRALDPFGVEKLEQVEH